MNSTLKGYMEGTELELELAVRSQPGGQIGSEFELELERWPTKGMLRCNGFFLPFLTFEWPILWLRCKLL